MFPLSNPFRGMVALALVTAIVMQSDDKKAEAGLLPDVAVMGIGGDFTSGTLSLQGYAMTIVELDGTVRRLHYGDASGTPFSPVANPLMPAVLELSLDINSNGGLTGGSFLLKGAVGNKLTEPAPNPAPKTAKLLEGTFTGMSTAFVPNGVGYKAEFTLGGNVTGGLLESDFGNLFALDMRGRTSTNNFLTSFNFSSGTADLSRSVPEPSSILLWSVALGGIQLMRRRRV